MATSPQSESPPSFQVPVLAITGLALAAMAGTVSMRITDALLPRLATEFSVSLGEAAQVVTAFSLAYGAMQLLFGPLGDRFGKLRVVGWACLASSLMALVCALAWSQSSRLLAGAAAAGIVPLAMAWIGDVVRYEQRQPVLARFLIGHVAGLAIGVWAGGYTAEHLHWRAPFFVIAVLFAAMAVNLFFMQRRLPVASSRPTAPAGRVWSSPLGEFCAVFGVRWARVVLLTVFLEGVTLFGAFPFIAAHLHMQLGLSLSASGSLLMLFAAGGMAFALSVRTVIRMGERAMVRRGSMAVAASLVTLAIAPIWWWAVPACFALGLGFYMMHNVFQVQATQMAPERRGTAVAAFASCFFLGSAAGVAVAGLLIQSTGTAWVLASGGLGVVAVAWNFNRQLVMNSARVEEPT